ncbi:MAG: agmatinase [Dehalococcoidia bacterium]|nr:agmatinase [Dehalococcoidia bacterium]
MVFDRMPTDPAFVGIPTFLKLPYIADREQLVAERPDVVIVGAPFDMAVTNRPGARYGPRAIRQASNLGRGIHHLELGVEPLRTLRVFDYGDASIIPSDIERSHEAIRAKVAEVAATGAIPIVLGGDHSITLPSATAVADAVGRGKAGIVHFDAHADTAPDNWGVLLGHGTPMRRLIESGAVPGRSFVQVGLRGYWPPPDVIDWMREQGLRWHLMAEIEQRGFDAVLEDAISEALDGPEAIYLSVDVDVLDPAYAPGTGTPEPGGLTSRELLGAVRRIVGQTRLVGMDVVEVAPAYDGPGQITAEVAHRVVLEALSALAAKN